MRMIESAAEESGLHLNHTLAGLLWIGLIYLLSWKPGVLEHLWSGSGTLMSAIIGALRDAMIF